MTAVAARVHHLVLGSGRAVAKLEPFLALIACIEAEVGCDPEPFLKGQEAFERLLAVVVAHDGQDHGGGRFSSSLFWTGERARGTVDIWT